MIKQVLKASVGYVVAGLLLLLTSFSAVAEPDIFYFHNDHLGTPQVVTDQDQNIVWKANYTPFGEADIVVEDIEMNIRFPGQYYDKETGYHYNYYRTYDPSMGRYIQSDPIGLNGGLNTYGYVGGNPVNNSDSLGLFPDALVDLGFISYDIYRIVNDNLINDCDNLDENLTALAADGLGLATPGATGLGVISRGANKAVDAIGVSKKGLKHIAKHTDEFKHFDPNFTLEDQVTLGRKIAGNPKNLINNINGSKGYEAVVLIGGVYVKVKAVVNSAGNLRTVYPVK